ncbi:MAG: lytic transglycosylase domain-containing protein [Candidatus Binatus sp.]
MWPGRALEWGLERGEKILLGTKLAASRIVKAVAALTLAIVFGIAAPPNASSETKLPFPHPASIEPNVDFWVNVFTKYSERDFVVVDRDDVSRIYRVFHLPGDGQPTRSDIDWANDYLKIKYGDILNRLAAGREPADDEERQIAAMFKGEPPSACAAAAQNLRVQEGLREQFHDGLLRSRYYMPTMERIFRSAGLPPELVTLAHVESGFHGASRSSAGAVGIWQFTRDTGKHYMRITRYHDDRLNPVRETQAAAKLLRSNYETLGDWPLAITAYNYGTGGIARAAGIYGGDYSEMVEHYQGPHFGFAVKNYYAEFLAALQVHRNEDKYFPGIEDEPAIRPAPIKTDFAPPKRSRRSHASHHHASSKTHHSKRTVAQNT